MVLAKIPLAEQPDEEEVHDGRVDAYAQVGAEVDQDRRINVVETVLRELPMQQVEREWG